MGLLDGFKARDDSKARFIDILNSCKTYDDGTISRNLKKAKFRIYCKPKIPTVKRPPRGKCGNVPEWVPKPINCDRSLTAEEKAEVYSDNEYFIIDNCMCVGRPSVRTKGVGGNSTRAKGVPRKRSTNDQYPGPSKRRSSRSSKNPESCSPCGSEQQSCSRSRRTKSRSCSTGSRRSSRSKSSARSCSTASEASVNNSGGCLKRRSRKRSSSCGPVRISLPRKCKSRAKSAPSIDCSVSCSPRRPRSSKSCAQPRRSRSRTKRCAKSRSSSCRKRRSVSRCKPKRRRSRRSISCGAKSAKKRRSQSRSSDACCPKPSPKRSRSRKRCGRAKRRKSKCD